MTGSRLLTRRGLLGGAAAGIVLTGLPSGVYAADARAASELDILVRKQMAAAQIPGLALGIAREGRVIFSRGYGFADLAKRWPVAPDTMFHIASITKTITATAIMLLVEDRRIVLDEPIAPHLDFVIAGDDAQNITFRHLLMHTSGISDAVYYQTEFRNFGADATMTLEALLRSYLVRGGRYTGAGNVKQVPGARWDYSNVGFALLGYLAGRIAGRDMRQFTRRRIFQPLGLRDIAWTIADTPVRLRATPYDLTEGKVKPVQPVGFPDWPTGMIRSSVRDLTLLVAAAANGGAANGVQVLGASANAEMLAMHRPAGLADWLTGQGLGWQQSLLDGIPRANHWGGDPGVFTMAYIDPDRQAGVVLLSNLSATLETRNALKTIAAHAFNTLAGQDGWRS